MFCTPERNGCGHHEADGCPNWSCEWSAFDAIGEERFADGTHSDNRGSRFDGLPEVSGQAVVTDVNLTYLATMTPEEARLMTDWARVLLIDESWGNSVADHWCGACRGHRSRCAYNLSEQQAVGEFLAKGPTGEAVLTEGMIYFWGNEIAGELRLFRGWCPHLPFDKRRATDEREWRVRHLPKRAAGLRQSWSGFSGGAP